MQDLTPPLQAKLLRVVEDRRFERLGGTRTLEVDVRFVAASSVDLRQAVQAGTFRHDLYHRLSVVPLTVPPLRDRREDILPLADTFLRRERGRKSTPASAFAHDTAEALKGYSWPGNVRELRSVIERAVLYTTGEVVPSSALPPHILEQPAEREYIKYVLDQVAGSQTRAAAILGISRKALWEKRRRYGIR